MTIWKKTNILIVILLIMFCVENLNFVETQIAKHSLFVLLGSIYIFIYLFEQKKELTLTKVAYKRKKELYNNLLGYMQDMVYYKNIKSEIIGCNDIFCNFFKVKKEDAIGKTFFEFFSEEENNKILKYEAIVLKEKRTVRYEINLNRGMEGKEYFFQVTKSPIYDEFDNIVGFSSICHDLTDIRLNEKDRLTLDEILTHDLKNPIIAQIKALDIIEKEQIGRLNNEQKSLIQQTSYSAKLVKELINSIIYLSKFEMKSYDFNPEKFDLKEMLESNLYKVQYIADNKNVKVIMNCYDLENSNICADMYLVERAIINLMLNAIICSIENDIIEVGLTNIGNNLKFFVKNKTVKTSMTPKKLKNFFNKYITSHENYRQVGFGIGMYLAQEVIKTYGGDVYADVIKAPNDKYDTFEFGFIISTVERKLTQQQQSKEMEVA